LICKYDAPTQFVEIQGTYQRDSRHFAGGGQLVDGENWAIDAGRIARYEANSGARDTLVAFPEYAARLDYNSEIPDGETEPRYGINGYPANMNLEVSCGLQTVMCCFTDDSMGDDFATNGDSTTDVCRHDLHDSPESNHIREGWSVFPGEEKRPHCVGFTWTDDDPSADLIGNMMYDVSLHQTATKKYRGGIPGAPMCGCVEHMPTVETAECRTATAGAITYTFTYDAETGDVSASNSLDVTYADCANPDLATQYKANHAGDEAAIKAIDAHLAGQENCEADIEEYLNEEQFLHKGTHSDKYLVPDPLQWSDIVVGEGIYFQPPDIEQEVADTKFRELVDPSLAGGQKCGAGADRHCIVRRVCASCRNPAHRDIYYVRISDLPPPEHYFLDQLMNQWTIDYNENKVDFLLYSDYELAKEADPEKAWTHCDYNNNANDGYGFPRNCGPTGYVWSEWNSYVRGGAYADHHGFYVELPN
jgi:hypothetical protein